MSKFENLDAKLLERSLEVFLTPTNVANALGISAKTLANWRVSGFGPKYVKLGSRVVYSTAELVIFVESRTRTSTSIPLEV
ncbi:DNA-binding protein, partial [Mesorhizobium sp. M7A.T.Ca.TU.009.01.3.1]